jgi:hypothetical protein
VLVQSHAGGGFEELAVDGGQDADIVIRAGCGPSESPFCIFLLSLTTIQR